VEYAPMLFLDVRTHMLEHTREIRTYIAF